MKRKIIAINEDLCDGCGLCCNGCPEGALRLVDGKARLVGDLLCDGLGACIGTCPRGAILVEEREAVPYEERTVMVDNIIPKGAATIRAHLEHLRDHGEDGYLAIALAILAEKRIAPPAGFGPAPAPAGSSAPAGASSGGGCPGLKSFAFKKDAAVRPAAPPPLQAVAPPSGNRRSELDQWPIQLHLINPRAPQFRGANLLLAADCVAFSVGDFHERWLKGRALAIACPKLDDGLDRYTDKLAVLFDEAKIDTLTVLRMHVPCCGGLVQLAVEAREKAKANGMTRNVPIKTVVVDPEGSVIQEEWI